MQLNAPHADSAPALIWGLPFLGMLLSIALGPLVAPRLWLKRMGVVAGFWSLALLLPEAAASGVGVAATAAWHAVLLEYLPFVALLLALFVAAGGVLLQGGPWGRPAGNTLLLAVGTLLAGVMGTTGAAMVLIHPLLRANAHRGRQTHLVLFFIILVANAGGATTPIGDPPLYLGFLQGVPFAWPLVHLGPKLLVVAGLLLPAFWLVDRHFAAADLPSPPPEPLRLRGWANVALLGAVVAIVLAQGVWHPGPVVLLGQSIGIERLGGIALLLGVAAASLAITPREVHRGNLFSWHPIEEVAILFAALFITIAPVLAMLAAGFEGPLAPLLRLTLDAHGAPWPLAYFWLTGVLSGFLDNAPTYLVFFQLAGGDAARLAAGPDTTLAALSAGAVFFGGLSYIGNAPNLMVRAIAAQRGVAMPGFVGFVLLSGGLLLPVFLVLSWVFFRHAGG